MRPDHPLYSEIFSRAISDALRILATLFFIFHIGAKKTNAQSPTCDVPTILAAFQGAGYVPLAVNGQPCSLYFVNPNSQSAGTAQTSAEALGANLVVMNDAAENTAVAAALAASAFNGATIWIGYQRTSAGANTFFASDGTTGPFVPSNGNPLIYQNWAAGEPNNNGYGDTDFWGGCDYQCTNGEQCTQIYSNAQWNDLPCNNNSISVIEVNLCPEITVTATANNVCSGIPVTLSASTLLGSEPYQYGWQPTNETTASITVSPPITTTYDVGVVDRYMCSSQEQITVTILQGPDPTFTVTTPACIGDPVTITYSGNGLPGSVYDWNFDGGVIGSGSGQGPFQVSWATSGVKNLTLQVTENGCASLLETQSVTVSPSPIADFTFTIECTGAPTNFTNTSSVTSGNIISTDWNFGSGNTSIISDPSFMFATSGTFPVTLSVVSDNGCPSSVTLQVDVNPGPTANFSSTEISCFGVCDGEATVTIQGGAQPYNVDWSDGTTGMTAISLCPGLIGGTITDANGCSITGQTTIIEPSQLEMTVVVTETSCPGLSDGTAIETISGGTAPYVSDWGGDTPSALAFGNYSVTATDANGCTVTELAAIQDGAGLNVNTVITDNQCFGGSEGEATITVTNGVGDYDIVWVDAFGTVVQTNLASAGIETISGLASLSYLISIVDDIGCATQIPISIAQPPVSLVMDLTSQDLSCFEAANGEIDATQNGLPPFDFELNDANGVPVENGQDPVSLTFQDLDVGIYFVTITDANGCPTTDAIEIFQPTLLQSESTVTNNLCNAGSNGQIEVTQVSGGTMPYSAISWNDPAAQNGNTAIGLVEGDYTATLTDANGCVLEESYVLSDPDQMELIPAYFTDTCDQGVGTAYVVPLRGTSPYTFLWSADQLDTPEHPGLHQGVYEVQVTDANGCFGTAQVTVMDSLEAPVAKFEYRFNLDEDQLAQQVQFIDQSTNTIQWEWNFGNGESLNEKNPLYNFRESGDYLVQLVVDNGFCNDTAYDYVNVDPLLTVYVPNAFTPGRNGINDFFGPRGEGIELESWDMFIYDRWGKLVWQTGNYDKFWDGTNWFSGEKVAVGNMFITSNSVSLPIWTDMNIAVGCTCSRIDRSIFFSDFQIKLAYPSF